MVLSKGLFTLYILVLVRYYRLRSEGYVFTGVCHFNSGGGGGGQHQRSTTSLPGPGHNTSPRDQVTTPPSPLGLGHKYLPPYPLGPGPNTSLPLRPGHNTSPWSRVKGHNTSPPGTRSQHLHPPPPWSGSKVTTPPPLGPGHNTSLPLPLVRVKGHNTSPQDYAQAGRTHPTGMHSCYHC